MEYLGFIFGIFGLLAYLQISPLKRRMDKLEEELTRTKGTSFHEDRQSLMNAVRSYTGEKVILTLKEDYVDADIVSYGNTKHGSNTILDADEDWMLIRIETSKGNKQKLIRMESIQSVSPEQK
ncbi:MAG: hypothetical protein IIZ27_11915 [Solobacterium sp.]|nr:hypothetical protein [Solobacterium sp.]